MAQFHKGQEVEVTDGSRWRRAKVTAVAPAALALYEVKLSTGSLAWVAEDCIRVFTPCEQQAR